MRPIDILALALQTPGSLPPLVWGPPGVGKSAQFRQLSAGLDLPLEVVIGSIREPADFSGLPIPNNGEGVRLEPPSWAVRLAKAGRGLLFLDEASCAAPAVQAAMLRVVLEKVVGDLQLPDGVLIAAAANPPDEAAGGWDLAAPLANRFVHLQWGSPTVAEWSDWLLTNGDGTVSAIPRVDPAAWAAEWPNARALVAAFLRRKPECLAEPVQARAGRFPLAYATPRTWECATRLLVTVRATGADEALMPLFAGALGEGVALTLATWLRENDLPDPEALLARPESWKPNANKTDVIFAVCLAVTEAAVAKDRGGKAYTKTQRKERWCNCWRVLERALPFGKDLVCVPARKLAAPANKPCDGALLEESVRAIIRQLGEVVGAAGIVS